MKSKTFFKKLDLISLKEERKIHTTFVEICHRWEGMSILIMKEEKKLHCHNTNKNAIAHLMDPQMRQTHSLLGEV